MMPGLTDTLCTRCALCCDGSLFADVELSGRAESTRLEILGLNIEDDEGGLLLQPCAALRGRRCGIYPHRPKCCRTFECQLLQDVGRGAMSVERAQEHITGALRRIGRIERMLARLGRRGERLPLKERCADALAAVDDAEPAHRRIRSTLRTEMNALERSIRTTFLGRPASDRGA